MRLTFKTQPESLSTTPSLRKELDYESFPNK